MLDDSLKSMRKRFVAARKALEMSQEETGRRLGVSSGTVSRWERGTQAIKLRDVAAIERLVESQRLGETAMPATRDDSDEIEYVVDQVRRCALRYRIKRDQGAPADELQRLLRELAVAVRGGLEVSGARDSASLNRVVDAFVDVLAHGGVVTIDRPKPESQGRAGRKKNRA